MFSRKGSGAITRAGIRRVGECCIVEFFLLKEIGRRENALILAEFAIASITHPVNREEPGGIQVVQPSLKREFSSLFARKIRLFIIKIKLFGIDEQQDCKDEQQGLYLMVYPWSTGASH